MFPKLLKDPSVTTDGSGRETQELGQEEGGGKDMEGGSRERQREKERGLDKTMCNAQTGGQRDRQSWLLADRHASRWEVKVK